MADALPIPDDLVQLQRELDAATAELAAYTQAQTAEYRERYPEPEQVVERARWSEEDATKLERLRADQLELVRAVHRHPTMEQARADGAAWPTEIALKQAARDGAPGVDGAP